MDDLLTKCIKLTKSQVEFINKQSKNLSRYIRALVDKEIGAAQARAIIGEVEVNKQENERSMEETKKSTNITWNFPK